MPVWGLTLTLRPLGQLIPAETAPVVGLAVTVQPTSMPTAACNSPQKSLATVVMTRLLSTWELLLEVELLLDVLVLLDVVEPLLEPAMDPEFTRNSDFPWRSDDGYAME
jgi:hypothetical protein